MNSFSFSKNDVFKDGVPIFNGPARIENILFLDDRLFVEAEGAARIGGNRVLHVPDNIFCLDLDGNVKWRIAPAAGPTNYPEYHLVGIKAGKLVIKQCSDYLCKVDMDSGEILSKEWTK